MIYKTARTIIARCQGWLGMAIGGFLALTLIGCDPVQNLTRDIISHDIAQYQIAAAKAGNDLLLENILRARDAEPLHFQEVSQIHGAATLGGSVGVTIPFGDNYLLSKAVNSVTTGASISTQPAFDLGTLDTQDFVNGIGQPIGGDMVQKILNDTDINSRLAVSLLLARVGDIGPYHATSVNSARCLASNPRGPECQGWVGFWRSRGIGSDNGRLGVHSIDELKPVGPILKGKDAIDLKTYATLDFSKVRFYKREPGYQLYSIETRYALCWQSSQNVSDAAFIGFVGPGIGQIDLAMSKQSQVGLCQMPEVVTLQSDGPRFRATYPTIETRSVVGLIQFLGDVLAVQRDGNCIILGAGFGELDYGACQQSGPLFRVDLDLGTTPVASTTHHKEEYSVRDCNNSNGRCDNSRQALSLLNYTLDLQKSSKSIPTTTTVRSLPGG